jgi:hypothetical protein
MPASEHEEEFMNAMRRPRARRQRADLMVLLGWAAAVASPRLSKLARPVIATFAFTCAWLNSAVFDAMLAPGWTIYSWVGAVIVARIVVITGTAHLWTQRSDGGNSAGHRDAHGADGPRRHPPHGPQHGGGVTAAGWWPEFERQLALYVAKRESDARRPVVLAVEPRLQSTGGGVTAADRHFADGNDLVTRHGR